MIVLLLMTLLSQPVTDIGVMTPNRAVILEKCTNRADFVSFTVELQALRWPSNYTRFQTTNEMLKMDDFAAMPPGPCLMGVKSTCADGQESSISLFRLDVRRDVPKPPQAYIVSIGAPPFRNSLTNVLRSRRMNTPYPPTPGVRENPVGGPLPGGKPETYSDGVINMQRYYAERRNQLRK